MTGSVKKAYCKEYFIFLVLGYLPLLWKVFQMIFLAPFENSMKIMAQIAFLSIIFKCLQETMINPLFKILGKDHTDEQSKNHYARKFFVVYSLVVAAFTLVVFLLLKPIMQVSCVPEEIFEESYTFLRIMVFVYGLQILGQYLFTFELISKNTKHLFYYMLISCFATLVLQIVFVPQFTLGLGVNGVAISTLIVQVSLIIFLLCNMPTKTETVQAFDKKEYVKLMSLSLAETIIRNMVYYFVILVFLNIVNNQNLYYVANDFIWSFMLIPVLAQNNVIKQEVSNNNAASLKPYFLHSLCCLAFMALLLPVAYILFRYVYQFAEFEAYMLTLLKLMPGYIIFVFDNVIESYFIASGKMQHVFMQSFLTNILVYGTAFVLYVCNVWAITLNSILILFNAGMIVSSAYTISVYLFYKKNTKFI